MFFLLLHFIFNVGQKGIEKVPLNFASLMFIIVILTFYVSVPLKMSLYKINEKM